MPRSGDSLSGERWERRRALSRADVVAIGVIAAVTALFFWEPIFAGRTLLLRDIHSLFNPWSRFTTDLLRERVLPLWNHFSFGGQPYAANPQIQLYYPPQLVFMLLPYGAALNTYVTIHTLLLGLSGYWMMRQFRFGPPAALLTALVLMFNGWTIRSQEFLTQFASLAWNPLVLVLWWRVIERRRPRDVIGLGIVLAVQTLAGHPQRQAYTLIMMVVAWVYLVSRAAVIVRQGKGREVLARIGWPAAGLALGGALAAVQVVPMVELSAYVMRIETPIAYSMWPSDLVNFVVPYFFGYPDWQKTCYVGVATLLCAAWGLALLWRRGGEEEAERRGFVLVALLWLGAGMLLAFGKENPLISRISGDLPYWRELMRWPTASLMIVTFSLAVLAGAGLEALRGQASRWAVSAACAFLLLLSVLAAIDTTIGMRVSSFMRHPSQHAQLARANPSTLMSQFPVLPHYVRLWLLTAGAGALVLLRRRLGRAFAPFLIGLLVVDLFAFSYKQNFYSPVDIYGEAPADAEELARMTLKVRLADTQEASGANAFLYGNRDIEHFRYLRNASIEENALPYHVFRFYGWRSMDLKFWRDLADLLATKAPVEMHRRIFELMGVGLRIGPEEELRANRPLPDAGLVGVSFSPWPRGFAVSGVLAAPDHRAAGEMLLSPSVDLHRNVILEGSAEQSAVEDFASEVTEVRYAANASSAIVRASAPGYLVMADGYYPGWQAYVNGRKAPVLLADVSIRAVPIEAGTQKVLLVYRPISFLVGAWLSLGGLLVVGALGTGLAVRALMKADR